MILPENCVEEGGTADVEFVQVKPVEIDDLERLIVVVRVVEGTSVELVGQVIPDVVEGITMLVELDDSPGGRTAVIRLAPYSL